MSVVVVIDPGHGSLEFLGGESEPYIEKDIDLSVAQYMQQYLSQFEGVEVYLTRNDDSAVELKDRCDIAKAYNADYFISIHFNMSVEHDLYGTEVWLSSKKDMYNALYPFAELINNDIAAEGIYSRGIKTRLGSSGDDYYAVIRHCKDYGIPACIIEHCYLDNENDYSYLGTPGTTAYEEKLKDFGIKDARAFAKFAHLKSSLLNEDYTAYTYNTSERTESVITPDSTAPDYCTLSVSDLNNATFTAKISIEAKDSNGIIKYYRYSLDGGNRYSNLLIWPNNEKSTEFSVNFDKASDNTVIAEVLNEYDIGTLSDTLNISFESVEMPEETKIEEADIEENIEDVVYVQADEGKSEELLNESSDEIVEIVLQNDFTLTERDFYYSNTFYLFMFGFIILLFVGLIVTALFSFRKKKRKKRPINKVSEKRVIEELDFEDDEI